LEEIVTRHRRRVRGSTAPPAFFLIVAVDYYSKWPEVGMCGPVTTSNVIDFLTALFDRFGLVEEITTDNGVQFTSMEFATFLQSLGIRHCKSALYNPQANAEVERFNRVLKNELKAAMADGHSFSTGLRQTLAAYRSTPHATTGVSPASLMSSFSMGMPLTLVSAKAASAARHEKGARRPTCVVCSVEVVAQLQPPCTRQTVVH
jgi:hypothetical protein